MSKEQIVVKDRMFDDNIYVIRLPDAVYTVDEASDSHLRYDTRVNDHHVWSYHRENGFSKIGVYDSLSDLGTEILRVPEAMVAAQSIVNKAYMKHLYPDTTVMAGVGVYPYEFDFDLLYSKSDSFECAVALPFVLSMGMPMFMYNIVLEKERKLQEYMKINGLTMANYWIVTFLFDYVYYCISAFLVFAFSKWGIGLMVFVRTHPLVIFMVFNGWGLA